MTFVSRLVLMYLTSSVRASMYRIGLGPHRAGSDHPSGSRASRACCRKIVDLIPEAEDAEEENAARKKSACRLRHLLLPPPARSLGLADSYGPTPCLLLGYSANSIGGSS